MRHRYGYQRAELECGGVRGARPRTRAGHPSGWNATPLSSFPSSIVLSLDTCSVYFFLPAVKFCTPPECGGS